MKKQVRCFNSNTDMQSYDELMHLKEYLNFRIKSWDYETKLSAANKIFDDVHKKFVQDEFNKLDVV